MLPLFSFVALFFANLFPTEIYGASSKPTNRSADAPKTSVGASETIKPSLDAPAAADQPGGTGCC